jgi:predicted NAD-dependent protein-ADP-ribosyltransferase YbiA (DUF1768 family)
MYYQQNRGLEDEDIGYDSPLYTIEIYDKQFLISLGKERKLVSKPRHYYFPVYLMNREYVQLQIGAFEYESHKEVAAERWRTFLDSDGDLDLNRLGDLILYSFADQSFFQEIKVEANKAMIVELEEKMLQSKVSSQEEGQGEGEESIEESPFDISEDDLSRDASIVATEAILKDGIFEQDKTAKRPAILHEETKELAAKAKKEYTRDPHGPWIEKYMRSNNFQLLETIDNTDSFYEAIVMAFKQIGYITTVKKLRALVAREVTESMFEGYREMASYYTGRKDTLEKEKRQLYATNKELKARVIKTVDKPQKNELIKQANEVAIKYNELKEEMEAVSKMITEISFMDGVDTIEKFRTVVQSEAFPMEPGSISILEKKLNTKFIILSQSQYEEGDENNVLICHRRLDKREKEQIFNPDHYIILSIIDNHYDIVLFKYKRILQFSELPYDIKILVTRKCMERNAGEFHLIPEFKDFASKLGIKGGVSHDDDDDDSDSDLDDKKSIEGGSINKSTVLVYYDKSATHPVGKGPKEKLDIKDQDKYTFLNLKKNKGWRKILDDSYPVIFTIDQMKWQSVEHYYQGAKFKKHHPDFYHLFSLDSNSPFCKDVELAKIAGSADGSYKKGSQIVELRPKSIRIDPDFYGPRKGEEREKALHAKFSQNLDIKAILLATHNAVLKRFIPKEGVEKDHELMKVRRQLVIEG